MASAETLRHANKIATGDDRLPVVAINEAPIAHAWGEWPNLRLLVRSGELVAAVRSTGLEGTIELSGQVGYSMQPRLVSLAVRPSGGDGEVLVAAHMTSSGQVTDTAEQDSDGVIAPGRGSRWVRIGIPEVDEGSAVCLESDGSLARGVLRAGLTRLFLPLEWTKLVAGIEQEPTLDHVRVDASGGVHLDFHARQLGPVHVNAAGEHFEAHPTEKGVPIDNPLVFDVMNQRLTIMFGAEGLPGFWRRLAAGTQARVTARLGANPVRAIESAPPAEAPRRSFESGGAAPAREQAPVDRAPATLPDDRARS